MNYCCTCLIHDINCSCYCSSPKVIWQILFIQHGMCYFCNVLVFPFINLWGITTSIFPLNSMLLQVFIEFIWKIFSPSIGPHAFNGHTLLLFHHCFEIQKMLKYFTFVFHEIDPHLFCVVINETHVIPASSIGLCLCGRHIWIDHFQRFGTYMSWLNWDLMPNLFPQLACFTNFWNHLFYSKFGETSNKILFFHQLKTLEINMAKPLVPNSNVSSFFSICE